MATGDINKTVPTDYINKFSRPISANSVSKLSQFSFIQQLSYNGILQYLKENFLGLKEWATQIKMYSQTNVILRTAYKVIEPLTMKNQYISSQIIDDPNLGKVGNLFSTVEGYNKTFAVDPQDLLDSDSITNTVSNTNVL